MHAPSYLGGFTPSVPVGTVMTTGVVTTGAGTCSGSGMA